MPSTFYQEPVVGQVFFQKETAQNTHYGVVLGKRVTGTFRREDGETCNDWTAVIATGHSQEVRIHARQRLMASSWTPLPAEEMEAMFGPQILALLNKITALASIVSELDAKVALTSEDHEARIAGLEQSVRDLGQSVRKLIAAQADAQAAQPVVQGASPASPAPAAVSAPTPTIAPQPQPYARRRG